MREWLARLPRGWALAGIVVLAFLVRTVFLFRAVFTSSGVNYQDSDAWYHMRLIENLVRHYPHRASIDPYLGAEAPVVSVPLLFDLFVAGLAWLIGLGAPSPRTLEVVAAIVPPALGALTCMPVAFIGERLFGRRAGWLAAALLAIEPGQFLARSVLGFTDHHVAEAFLTALTVLAALRALDADTPRRRLIGAAITGVALSAYLMAWSGGALLVFVLCAWGAAQYALDDLHRQPSDRVAPLLLPALALTAVVLLSLQDRSLWRFAVQVTAVVAGLGFIAAMAGGRRLLRILGAPRGALIAAALVVAVGGVLIFSLVARDLTARILVDLQRFRPGHTGFTVSEIRPLLLMTGAVSLMVPVAIFGPSFYIGLPSLGWLAWRSARTSRPPQVLFVVWSGLMYLATLGQNRFGYYLALCLALLTGWACDLALTWAWASPGETRVRLEARPRSAPRRAPARTAARSDWALLRRITPVTAFVAAVMRGERWPLARRIATLAIVVAMFGVSGAIAWPMAGNDLGLSDGYRASLGWLRASTPEPFGDPDYYFASYRSGETTKPAYTVMAWWDYGYEIMRLGRRVPVANPTQAGADVAGRFFTATDEAEGERILDEVGARYVIAHAEVPILPRGGMVQGKFETLVAWAGKDISRYWESFITHGSDGQLGSTTLFHAEYYRTLAVRLYVYGGAAAAPQDTTYVVSFAERAMRDGTRGKEILESRRFKTYEAALAYLDRFGRTGRAIVGIDPKQTPVPLEPIRHLRLIHESSGATPPAVRIFEYSPSR